MVAEDTPEFVEVAVQYEGYCHDVNDQAGNGVELSVCQDIYVYFEC